MGEKKGAQNQRPTNIILSFSHLGLYACMYAYVKYSCVSHSGERPSLSHTRSRARIFAIKQSISYTADTRCRTISYCNDFV